MTRATYESDARNAGWLPAGTTPATVYRDGVHHQSVTLFDDNLDAFSRLRVSTPTGVFDSQFTYDLQPLLYEQVVGTTDATITHDATNRVALFTFSGVSSSDTAHMQSYENFRYQPGKSQQVFITFNFVSAHANVNKYAGLSNGTNGFEFRLSGSTPQFVILSNTGNGNQSVSQSSWNIDPLDGTGESGITLDLTKEQILVIDFQALYVGRVRFGFDINGRIIYAHQFLHANATTSPYIATANLPIRVGMTATGTATTTMQFNCCTVVSEGGQEDVSGYSFSAVGSATAGSGALTHILSIRPKTTFNSISNRTKFVLDSVDILVTGNSAIRWDLCVGQAISGTTTFTSVNNTYSAFEYNTAGTISGTPAIVIASGYVAATATSKSVTSARIVNRYPITLNAAGAVRALGTLTLLVFGVTADSACRAIMNWHEIR